MRKVLIEVTSIEKLKEEVKTVEKLESMTITELNDLFESMSFKEALRLQEFMKKWGIDLD